MDTWHKSLVSTRLPSQEWLSLVKVDMFANYQLTHHGNRMVGGLNVVNLPTQHGGYQLRVSTTTRTQPLVCQLVANRTMNSGKVLPQSSLQIDKREQPCIRRTSFHFQFPVSRFLYSRKWCSNYSGQVSVPLVYIHA